MLARAMVVVPVLVASVSLAVPRPSYAVSWGRDVSTTQEALGVRDQLERRLRACDEGPARPLVLQPRLELSPRALRVDVVVMRSADRSVVGSITTRAVGSSREAQLRAVASQVCREASQL